MAHCLIIELNSDWTLAPGGFPPRSSLLLLLLLLSLQGIINGQGANRVTRTDARPQRWHKISRRQEATSITITTILSSFVSDLLPNEEPHQISSLILIIIIISINIVWLFRIIRLTDWPRNGRSQSTSSAAPSFLDWRDEGSRFFALSWPSEP